MLQRINCFDAVEGRDPVVHPSWGAPPPGAIASRQPRWNSLRQCSCRVAFSVPDDQGQTWQPTIDFHVDVHEVCTTADHPNWVLAATAQGLALSQDRGRHPGNLIAPTSMEPMPELLPVCGETILMTASHRSPHWQSSDLSSSFRQFKQGSTNVSRAYRNGSPQQH